MPSEFVELQHKDEHHDSRSDSQEGHNGNKLKCFVAFAILLLLASTAVALYFILRPGPLIAQVVNKRFDRLVPCPRTPGMTGNYTSGMCVQQPNCQWILFNESLRIPYNCTYNIGASHKWSLQSDRNTSESTSFLLKSSGRTLYIDLSCRAKNQLHLKVSDNTKRYEVPTDALPIADEYVRCNTTAYQFEMEEGEFSTLHIRHKGVSVLSIPFDGGFVFDTQFIQMTARLNSSTNYGFGEHNHRQLLLDMNYKTWAIFTRDVGVVDAWNLYGAQPYFMSVNSGLKSVIGTLLLNSNAMDVHVQPAPYPSVTYRLIGGLIDLYFFIDDSPEQVTQHYTSLVGRPLLPPYWSLGFQLSRWGYQNTDHVKTVVSRNQAAGIPLDVVYGDIDYMQDKLDFTYDKLKFADLPDYVDKLRANHTRYIIILDPGIGMEVNKTTSLDGGAYKALDDGIAKEIFIKEANGSKLVGKVWPGEVYFPDFTNPNATTWWKEQIWDFYNNSRAVSDSGLKFDALWVDMNEPANFRDREKAMEVCNMDSKWNSPPYIPERLLGNSLVDKTICMDSLQHWGRHYDVHSLYGHSMAMATNKALQDLFPAKRPLVLTRSTFTGTNKHAIHWLGDNHSKWDHVAWSIVGMLEFSMFGFSMTGADICGFWFNTTESMCQRWMQVGAFYPYARNHNGDFPHGDQDPANFGEDMIASSREVLLTRYKLLPYLYTLMYKAHSTGSTVARPLFYEFMNDNHTHNIGRQFLWGPALLISPCLEQDSVEVEVYIPEGTWYDYYSGEEIEAKKWHNIHTPENKINLHVRGGHVIPWQHPDVSTHASKQRPFGLLVALDAAEEAFGELYIDDGESADPITSGNYSLMSLKATSGKLKLTVEMGGYPTAPNQHIDTIEVYGLKRKIDYLLINDGKVTNFTLSQSNGHVMIGIQDSTFTYLSNHTIRWFAY